ncbi:MAG: hypothetical protein RMJ56_17220 [Gemmataceae bacterium]|nr:hypothetical protein [Gemmata sp.]MDW8199338.1 hypothetical protein [Gemmataceae bacterium]
MTEKLLQKLSEWHPTGTGRHSLITTIPETGWSVQLLVDKADSLSCLIWEMTLVRTDPAPAGITLRSWAEAIAQRVTGLLEPLKLLEVDETRHEAILRSQAPSPKGDQLAYYEVHLYGTHRATVSRFHASRNTSGRKQVPYALTHEVLAKLAGDITA